VAGNGDVQPVGGQPRRADGVGDGEGLDRDRFGCLDPCRAHAQCHREGGILPAFHAFSPRGPPRPLPPEYAEFRGAWVPDGGRATAVWWCVTGGFCAIVSIPDPASRPPCACSPCRCFSPSPWLPTQP